MALKSFNRDSISVDRRELQASSSRDYGEYEWSKFMLGEFLVAYGFSGGQRLQSLVLWSFVLFNFPYCII